MEQNNLLEPKNFEGFGSKKNKNGPAARLRKTYINDYITKKKNNNKHQKGGFVIPVWLATMLIAGGAKITESLLNHLLNLLHLIQ